jgi:rhamnose transport system substrate-binding protein
MRGPTKTLVTGVMLVLFAIVGLASCDGKESAGQAAPIRIAFVPKVRDLPYFQAMDTGGEEAAQQLGVDWMSQGPATVDPADQIAVVRGYIAQRVDVIVVAPNDPAAIAPVLAEARSKGIHVMTSDTDAPASQRELFVNQATAEGVGDSLTDALMTKMGGAGKYAIVSCGQSAENLNSWIAAQKAYAAVEYPSAQLVDTVYAGEDTAAATLLAKSLMAAHPDLTGLVGECTTSAPGVAQAVRDTQNIGRVYTVGVGTPQAIKPYLNDGSCSASVLWNVEALGYLTAWAADQLATGKPLAPVNKVSGELPSVHFTAATKTLLLGDPLQITSSNVDQFKY